MVCALFRIAQHARTLGNKKGNKKNSKHPVQRGDVGLIVPLVNRRGQQMERSVRDFSTDRIRAR